MPLACFEKCFLTHKYQWVLHLSFWLFYILLTGITYIDIYYVAQRPFSELTLELLQAFIITIPFRILFFYVVVYRLIDKYLLRNNLNSFSYLLVGLLTVISIGEYLLKYVLASADMAGIYSDITPFHLLTIISVNLAMAFTGGFFHLVRQNLRKTRMELERSVANLETELKFLKTQTHPDFLMNTLNNLYSLTLIKSDEAPEMVTDLANLLRYLFYEYTQPHVSFQRELEVYTSYLKLEQKRYGDRLKLKQEINIDNLQESISPLLILPFIDNAFKHGAATIRDPWINITIKLQQSHFHLRVENNTKAIINNSLLTLSAGLTTVHKRLSLLYPGKHELNFSFDENTFRIDLSIQLK